MKIALVMPNTRTMEGTTCPPLGLMFIAAVLKEKGHTIRIFDRNIDFFIFTKIKKFKPDIVGISALTGPMLLDVIGIAKEVKLMFGESFPVVMGGVHASLLPDQTLENPFINYVVIGEGEHTFVELIDAIENKKDLSKILGIGYKKNGEIVINKKKPLIENLDEIPLLPWDLVRYKMYFKFDIILVTSRGCPYRCAFCYNLKFNESRWRGMSAERVIKEIKNVEKLTKSKDLGFHDDNFTADKERLDKILDYLSSDYNLFIETRINYVDDEFLKKFKKFKNVWFFFGVESGSQRMLNKMKKGLTIEQIKKAFQLCKEYKIKTTASVMLGSPTETKEELEMTLKLLDEIKPTRYTYYLYNPYPGSELFEEIIKKGLFTHPKTLEGWANFSTDIRKANLEILNLSSVNPRKLKQLNMSSWLKTIKSVIKSGDFHKIKMRILNYQPFIIPYCDPLDKFITKLIKNGN